MPASIPKGIFCFKVVWTIFFFLFAISQIISNLLECINQLWHTVKLMPKKQNWQSWTASLFYFSGCLQTYHFVISAQNDLWTKSAEIYRVGVPQKFSPYVFQLSTRLSRTANKWIIVFLVHLPIYSGSSCLFVCLFLSDGECGSVGDQLLVRGRKGWRKPRKFGWEQQSAGCPLLVTHQFDSNNNHDDDEDNDGGNGDGVDYDDDMMIMLASLWNIIWQPSIFAHCTTAWCWI